MTDPIKVLLVEDVDVDRLAVRRCLRDTGLNIELTEAVNGVGALKACEDNRFDCVLLDYRLPDRNGATVLQSMLADHDSVAAVIFLTGLDNEELALEMMQAGAVDYLTKDEITAPTLRRAVRYATARRNFLTQLSELARADALTGLPNRSVFEGLLTKAISQAARTDSLVAVSMLDLDHFKNINDTLGHPAGDSLLKMAAERLLGVVRKTDTVIRLGGDEFVVISPTLSDARGAAIQAQKLIDALSTPFQAEGQELFVSTSIGIALAPLDGSEAAGLMKSADMALYKAKADGRGTFHFYDDTMNTAALEQRSLEAAIRQALAGGEFDVYYQPKLNTETNQVLGTEALIRWNHAERGVVSPADFIPAAERCQLIWEIGDWVLQRACAQNVAWQRAGLPPLNCSINVSPLQFRDSRLIHSIDSAIEASGFDPAYLEIEITESALLKDPDRVAAILTLLRTRGISVSIDDFGTGYSSLAHLKQLPVDKLKIDRSFISNIPGSKDDREIASAIISLAGKLGVEVIAEGVETESQLEFLRQEGCDQVQGYLFSRPLCADDFANWYRTTQGQQALAG